MFFAINFVSVGSFISNLEVEVIRNEARNVRRERIKKRFKIISFSRSTYTNIIYLHVVFEITMFVSYRVAPRGLFASPVYFINLFMFMNIVPHKNLSERRENETRRNAKEMSGLALGSLIRSSMKRGSESPRTLSTKSKERKEEDNQRTNRRNLLVNELRSFS